MFHRFKTETKHKKCKIVGLRAPEGLKVVVSGMKCIDMGSEAIKTFRNIFHLRRNLDELKKAFSI